MTWFALPTGDSRQLQLLSPTLAPTLGPQLSPPLTLTPPQPPTHFPPHPLIPQPIALISDAGMPAISDPGEDLVAAAVAAGVPVWPIPGPCAALCGLVGSGLPTSAFLFCGFLPPKQHARRAELRRLAGQRATLVVYAPPHALVQVLGDAVHELGGRRRAVVARELTKMHEEFHRCVWGAGAQVGFQRLGAGSCLSAKEVIIHRFSCAAADILTQL